MAQSFELGQLANLITVNDSNNSVGIAATVNITGGLSAASIVGSVDYTNTSGFSNLPL